MKRRSFFGFLAGFGAYTALKGPAEALAAGTPTATAREATLPSLAFAPTLTNVLNFARTKADIVCVGDTDHEENALMHYFSDAPTMKKLAGGKPLPVFLEMRTEEQPHFDKLKAKTDLSSTEREACTAHLYRSKWSDPNVVRQIAEKRAETIRSVPQVQYHAADTRGDDVLFDETGTANRILRTLENAPGQEAGALLAFGGAHFSGASKRLENQPCLYDQLKTGGLRPLTVNVFFSEAALKEDQDSAVKHGALYRQADIDLLAYPGEKPHIVFRNEKLRQEFAAWSKHNGPVQTQAKNDAPVLKSRRQFLGLRPS